MRQVVACLMIALVGNAEPAEPTDGRWALRPHACAGDLFTRAETPLIVSASSVRWFDTNCSIVSNYKVNQTLYLQGQCLSEGRRATIPIMLEPRGDRLRVGWNREPIVEMQKCP